MMKNFSPRFSRLDVSALMSTVVASPFSIVSKEVCKSVSVGSSLC